MKELSRADLHVHSKYSKRPSEWVLQKIGCSESYTEPVRIYNIARERGMDFVTITDHNTLEGSLEIAHLENSFISEEITTYFPENRCKMHILAYNIDERHHEDITRLRENIFDLAAYLNKENIVHAVAHPMFAVNDRLSVELFEQSLILFSIFEMNGTRDNYQNRILRKILGSLTKRDMDKIIEKHRIRPFASEPWKKHIIGGSDDHSSLNIARVYTEVDDVSCIEGFLKGLSRSRAHVGGKASTPKTMAHNLYSIAYQYYKNRFGLSKFINEEPLLRFADRALTSFNENEEGLFERLRSYVGYRRPGRFYKNKPGNLQDLLLKEARSIIDDDSLMSGMIRSNGKKPEMMDDICFRFVNRVSEQICKAFGDSILENISGANIFDIFNSIGSAGSLYTMLSPYFVAYGLFTKDRQFCRDCRDYFIDDGKEYHAKVAHFTDTYYEVNGVAKTLRLQVDIARKTGKDLTMITCGPEQDTRGVIHFPPIGSLEMPEYPELKLYYPPLLRMLDFCYNQNFTHIHSATPGPMGLAALVIAKILKIPLYTTYHTALPEYTEQLTQDPAMEELMWKYVLWYYKQTDLVFVPSQTTGDELIAKGIKKEKIRFYTRGIDVDQFHPSKRNGFFKERFQLKDDIFKLLYVGRISKEKNLELLVRIFKRIAKMQEDIHLVIVGDGPYLGEMKQAMKGLPVLFTGYLEGEDLCQIYASSDLFIFPSTTDTFGNVVLEAQASGLPVIVSDGGGPKENLISGKTGFVVPACDSDGYVQLILSLCNDRGILSDMRTSARSYMENRSFESAHREYWKNYRIHN